MLGFNQSRPCCWSAPRNLGHTALSTASPILRAIASVYRGSALSMLGSAEEGLALVTEGLVAYRARALLYVPNFLSLLAHCYHRAGQPKEGLKYLDEAAREAARQIEATEEHSTAAEMHRLRGELLIAVGDPIAAEASFCRAIAVAGRQKAKLWELRAATNLGAPLARSGQAG